MRTLRFGGEARIDRERDVPVDEQRDRLHAQLGPEPGHRLQREVPFAALDAADVGAVQPDPISERLLGETRTLAQRPDVAPQDQLQVVDGHPAIVRALLLIGLQTHE